MSQSYPGHYEPIESASIDELRDLQLKRLGDTLSHAYANVAHYRQAFDSAGVAQQTSRTSTTWLASRSSPRATCATPTRSASSQCPAPR